MVNYLSICNNKPFTLHTQTITSGYPKKIANDIQKSHVKCFPTGYIKIIGIKDLHEVL